MIVNEREKTIYQQGFMSGSNAAQAAIKAAEHRAEVAERAGKIAASKVFDYTYEEAVAQAERELSEESKNDKS